MVAQRERGREVETQNLPREEADRLKFKTFIACKAVGHSVVSLMT